MIKHGLDSIERTAQGVLREAGALTVPTDLDKVLGSLNVHVHEEEMEADISGVLIIKGEQRHVLLNKTHGESRKRFTIAHELGHLMLHDDGAKANANGERMFIDHQIRVYQRTDSVANSASRQDDSLTTPEQETEANAFAAALLMPSHHVVRASLERDLFDEISVAALAKTFDVSEQAMSIRLQQLRLVMPNVGTV